MVSTRPPTFMFSSPFSNPLVIVPNAPITIGIIATFMLHFFFNSLSSASIKIGITVTFMFYFFFKFTRNV